MCCFSLLGMMYREVGGRDEKKKAEEVGRE